MSERFIENVKVILRKNKLVFLIAKFLYLPVVLYQKVLFQIDLNKKIEKLHKQLQTLNLDSPKVFYFCVPIHENLGDAAQMYCIRKWIKENFPTHQLVEIEAYPTYSKAIRKDLKNCIGEEDFLITESGATFSDRHQDHGVHRYLLHEYTSNRLIIMPQTVDLPDENEMKKTAELFNNHPKAVFLARDPESYRMVKPYFNMDRVMLFPDIVTTLIGRFDSSNKRSGILVCKRIDGEKKYDDYSIKNLLSKLQQLGKVDMTDTNFDHSLEYTYANLEEEITNKLNLFAKYKVILTDRYHGMIFSLVSNTPVVVIPTSGHKVKMGAKWFKEDYPEGIYFCETLDEAYNTINNILNNNITVRNKSIYYDKYYKHLLNKYNSII